MRQTQEVKKNRPVSGVNPIVRKNVSDFITVSDPDSTPRKPIVRRSDR